MEDGEIFGLLGPNGGEIKVNDISLSNVRIDPQSRNHILETVKRLNKEKGLTVIYTIHYMEEVEFLCKRVGLR